MIQFESNIVFFSVVCCFALQELNASFRNELDLNSSCGTDADWKPRSGIAQSRQGGATRKAGWLSVKHVLVRLKSGKVELASDRKWRKCWVSLKNGALNFYVCNEKTVSPQDLDDPTFILEIDGCIAQAVPEHAKLDHVFSVSSRLGEGYYFQVFQAQNNFPLIRPCIYASTYLCQSSKKTNFFYYKKIIFWKGIIKMHHNY